jgi:hypothetical protein
MFMTIDEAKTKWCPMAANSKAIGYGAGVIPLIGMDKATVAAGVKEMGESIKVNLEKCVADGCMWWVADFDEGNGCGHCGGVNR